MAGLGKYFNSNTYTGRANVAKATYASFALMYLVYRIRRSNKAVEPLEELEIPPAESEPQHGCGCDACQKKAQAAAKEQKLTIPDDPLLKPRKKPCDCDKHSSNEKHSSKPPIDEDEGCID